MNVRPVAELPVVDGRARLTGTFYQFLGKVYALHSGRHRGVVGAMRHEIRGWLRTRKVKQSSAGSTVGFEVLLVRQLIRMHPYSPSGWIHNKAES